MRTYPCKKPVTREMVIENIIKIAGNYKEEDNYFITKIPPIEEIKIRINGEKEIEVETRSGQGGDTEAAIKKYNQLIEAITGYSAKERKKILMKG